MHACTVFAASSSKSIHSSNSLPLIRSFLSARRSQSSSQHISARSSCRSATDLFSMESLDVVTTSHSNSKSPTPTESQIGLNAVGQNCFFRNKEMCVRQQGGCYLRCVSVGRSLCLLGRVLGELEVRGGFFGVQGVLLRSWFPRSGQCRCGPVCCGSCGGSTSASASQGEVQAQSEFFSLARLFVARLYRI